MAAITYQPGQLFIEEHGKLAYQIKSISSKGRITCELGWMVDGVFEPRERQIRKRWTFHAQTLGYTLQTQPRCEACNDRGCDDCEHWFAAAARDVPPAYDAMPY